jgi:hypothetical protein
MLLGTILSLPTLICIFAVDSQAQTDKSEHKGIIYRNPRVYNVDYSFEMSPDPNKIDRSKDLKVWIMKTLTRAHLSVLFLILGPNKLLPSGLLGPVQFIPAEYNYSLSCVQKVE